MFGMEFPIDPKLQAAIIRRRNREDQRKSRILNEKIRRIGIDVEALNRQVQERTQIRHIEKHKNEELEKEMLLRDEMAVMAQEHEQEQRRRFYQAMDHFRMVCQRPETQRDFDLNDPERLKKARPPRDPEYGDICGPASLQKFDGEDTEKAERDRQKRGAQRVWLERQRQERMALERRAKEEKEKMDAHTLNQAKMATEATQLINDHRKRMEAAIQDYNLQLMGQKQAHGRLIKQQEMERNIVDMESHIFSDILAEDPSVARTSTFGPHRIVADRWKGMTAEEVESIFRSRRAQIVEKQLSNSRQKRDEEAWDQKVLREARAELLRERQRYRAIREHERRIMEENRRLASEQRTLQEHLNRNVYRGLMSDDFFSRFGASCR